MIKVLIYVLFIYSCHRKINHSIYEVNDSMKFNDYIALVDSIEINDLAPNYIRSFEIINDSLLYYSDFFYDLPVKFNFLTKKSKLIGKIGEGPCELSKVWSFDYNEDKNNLIILDKNLPYLFEMSLVGDVSESKFKFAMNDNFHFSPSNSTITKFGSNYVITYDGAFKFYAGILDSNFLLVRNILEVPEKNYFAISPFPQLDRGVIIDSCFYFITWTDYKFYCYNFKEKKQFTIESESWKKFNNNLIYYDNMKAISSNQEKLSEILKFQFVPQILNEVIIDNKQAIFIQFTKWHKSEEERYILNQFLTKSGKLIAEEQYITKSPNFDLVTLGGNKNYYYTGQIRDNFYMLYKYEIKRKVEK